MLDGDVEIQELSADELLNASAKTNANDHVATDIEMANFAPQSLSASVPSRVEGHLPKSARSASQAVCMAKKLERNNNLKKLLAPGASRDDHEGWFDPKAKQPKKTSHSNIEWDVFLSYRVAADKNLVGELYWQLHSLTVMDCGKERKLRVFWDVECLKSGEKWEQGFSKAICSTSLVVIVMSRNAYKMEGETHNVEGLTEESNCDNVILEYGLALDLSNINGTAILPLFVGDKTEETYSHFFESGCMPKCSDVIVDKISSTIAKYLEENAGVAAKDLPKARSVKTIMNDLTQFQGFFLQGPAHAGVKAAINYLHTCVTRLVQERDGKINIEKLQFSNPQGEEVFEFLSVHALSHYTSTFASNKLNSLRKVSQMTCENVSKVHKEFCASTSRGDTSINSAQVGRLVLLAKTVQSLKNDPRTKTLKEQLLDFKDPTVSGVNLLGAQNQVEVILAKKKSMFFIICCFSVLAIFYLFEGVNAMSMLNYTVQTRSVLTYSVQLSNDAKAWRDVSCAGSLCIFDSSALVAQQDKVVSTVFPQQEVARYIQILLATWEGKDWNGKTFGPREGAAGADFRVGFLEGVGKGKLNYRLITHGGTGQAWLQNGCKRNSSMADTTQTTGQWASVHAAIGEVQCCLTWPRVHVCTRDGCLSGDNDARKVTWPEAKTKCEARGWRLCRREELNRYDSAGCCDTLDRCGYNAELVWTSNVGGLQPYDTYGQLYSDTAIEGVTKVTVDLGEVQIVRGVKLQGGVPETSYNGPACVFRSFHLGLSFGLCGVPVGMCALKSPYMGVRGLLGAGFAIVVLQIIGIVTLVVDPRVPSVVSMNVMCPGLPEDTDTVTRKIENYVMYATLVSAYILLLVLRPQFFIIGAGTSLLVSFAVLNSLEKNTNLAVLCFAATAALLLSFIYGVRWSKSSAQKVTSADVKKYEQKWAELGGRGTLHHTASPTGESALAGRGPGKIHPESETNLAPSSSSILAHDHLLEIEERCSTAAAHIALGLQRACSSNQFTWWKRLLFWIRAGGLGPFSRTRKIRQTTFDIDILFAEAAIVNDDFLDFLQSEMKSVFDTGWMCRGPIKRPDRALQKVVRRFYRDPRCLTDLVRCVILVDSIAAVRQVLEEFLDKSVVAGAVVTLSANKDGQKESGKTFANKAAEVAMAAGKVTPAAVMGAPTAEAPTAEPAAEDLKPLLEGSRVEKYFRLCKIKDRFSTQEEIGYRDICLNVEVGWTIASESEHVLDFVTIDRFEKKGTKTHICEVQLMLESMYELKVGGCHDNFVEARNLLSS